MITNNLKCAVCGSNTKFLFTLKVLNKYFARYIQCINCKLIRVEKPHWLEEAYSTPIVNFDTGIIARNNIFSKISSICSLLFCGKNSKVLDYAGGYGILTRMMRDIGVDCYWSDKYADNLFAQGFEENNYKSYDVVTAYELFEHLENPKSEIKKIINKYHPKCILFSTMLHRGTPPKNWWYLSPEGGQHIAFYTRKSLKILANTMGMKFATNGRNFHVFSKKYVPDIALIVISIFWPILSMLLILAYKSKTFSDRSHAINLR